MTKQKWYYYYSSGAVMLTIVQLLTMLTLDDFLTCVVVLDALQLKYPRFAKIELDNLREDPSARRHHADNDKARITASVAADDQLQFQYQEPSLRPKGYMRPTPLYPYGSQRIPADSERGKDLLKVGRHVIIKDVVSIPFLNGVEGEITGKKSSDEDDNAFGIDGSRYIIAPF
jgi:hypothetical protein